MSRISRLVSGVGVLLVLLGAAGTPAEANAIYSVARVVPNPSLGIVAGELVTDGTLGVLGSANVVDWNLTVVGVLGSETLLGPASGPNSFIVTFGDSLTATPDGLYFDFGVVGFMWITNSGFPELGSSWCLENHIGLCNIDSGETIVSKSVDNFALRTGMHKVATLKSTAVDVPEPGSVLLVAGGLLGFAGRRRRTLC